MKKLIYAADDDASIREILETFLIDASYDVKVFENGDLLYDAFTKNPCDLVILDIMMPGSSGIEVTKKIRENSTVPIILLTAKDTDMDFVLGINSGSDDYMIKPFRPSILMSRIKAIFRRIEMLSPSSSDDTIYFGDLSFSKFDHTIKQNDQELKLTETEFQVLSYMIKASGRAISRDELLEEVWGIEADIETRVTDETVRRLRKKLLAIQSNVAISTVWGFGYKLEVVG